MTTDDLDRLTALAEAATVTGYDGRFGPREQLLEGGRHLADQMDQAGYVQHVALDPQTVLALIESARFGLAWNRAEAALPEGWQLSMLWRTLQEPWAAYAAPWAGTPGDYVTAFLTTGGRTPTAALLALADKLEAREP